MKQKLENKLRSSIGWCTLRKLLAVPSYATKNIEWCSLAASTVVTIRPQRWPGIHSCVWASR